MSNRDRPLNAIDEIFFAVRLATEYIWALTVQTLMSESRYQDSRSRWLMLQVGFGRIVESQV